MFNEVNYCFTAAENGARAISSEGRPTNGMRVLLVGLTTALLQQPLPRVGRASAVRMMSSDNLNAMTVVQLKERLRQANLPVSGRKAELVARLLGDVPSKTVAPVETAFPSVEIAACKS